MQQQDQGGPRYFSFIVASLMLLLIWNSMFNRRNPPVDPNEGGPDEDGVTEIAQRRTPLDDLLPVVVPPDVAADNTPAFVSLGSVDSTSPHRMQVNFASRGAVVHRVQLASPKFRDIDDRRGHLGEIEPTNTAGGVRVEVVPDGSPAAAAGLEPGDIITAAGREETSPVEDVAALQKVLATTKPRQEFIVDYTRGGKSATTTVQLMRAPLDLIRPEVENIDLHSDELPEDFEQHSSFELQIDSIGPVEPDKETLAAVNDQLRNGVWAVEQPDSNTVVFRKRAPEFQLEFVKRFELKPVPESGQDDEDYRGYHFDLQVSVRNLKSEPQTVAYGIQGPNGLTIEGWWYSNKVGKHMFRAVGIRDVVVRVFGQQFTQFGCPKVTKGNVDPVGQGASIAFAGVDAQYFASAMFPLGQSSDEGDIWIESIQPQLASTKLAKDKPVKYNNSSFTMTRKAVQLAAAGGDDSGLTDNFLVFAGPKKPAILEQYYAAEDPNYSISDFLYYGWFWWVAKPMLWLLHLFAGVGNYGIAIIMLTVLVRGCMVPISRKQAKNMMKMQELKPEIDRINAKYKEDMQKRAAAQQALWKEHNYNPMGGCLPMFLQFPIFIGLYRSLMVDVELRQTPLFTESIRWCSNLAAPDMLFDWSSWWWQSFNNGYGILALGPYLNILPLATVALFLAQQKMFMPPPTDEQSAMIQRMMKYMMFFMALMFFKVASGLCLYFIASSVWGIVERKLIPRPTPPANTSPPPAEPTKRKQAKEDAAKSAEKARRKKKR